MKYPILTVLCAFGVGFLASCEKSSVEDENADSEVVMQERDYEVGEYNKDGRLVFWEVYAYDHMQPFVLYEDYGVMLVNEGGEEKPSPLYILVSQKEKKVIKVTSLEDFQRELSKIPEDAKVGKYGTCSLPRTWGLPDEDVSNYHAYIDELGSKHEIQRWAVCYCPNRN